MPSYSNQGFVRMGSRHRVKVSLSFRGPPGELCIRRAQASRYGIAGLPRHDLQRAFEEYLVPGIRARYAQVR